MGAGRGGRHGVTQARSRGGRFLGCAGRAVRTARVGGRWEQEFVGSTSRNASCRSADDVAGKVFDYAARGASLEGLRLGLRWDDECEVRIEAIGWRWYPRRLNGLRRSLELTLVCRSFCRLI